MALEHTANAKPMSELSILTILVQAAAIVKNEDGDGSLHGYVELQGLRGNRRAMESDYPQSEVELAVLESIGDILLLNHQILALTHNKRNQEEPFVALVVTSDWKAESELELPAEYPIRSAVKVSTISATVVPNPDDRRREPRGSIKGDQSESGALGNIKLVSKGNSMWDKIKEDPIVVK